MGLYAFEIGLLANLLLPKPCQIVSFGHPDVLATPDELEPIFGRTLPIDPAGVIKARGKGTVKSNIVGNARIVAEALGGTLDVWEASPKLYNVDYVIDLNHPFPVKSYADLVIDPGTSEHCFNVGTALVNMANFVKKGGFIYHRVPLCHWNHGFWNFSPCAFGDFYEQNGFKILTLAAESKGKLQTEAHHYKKFEIANHGRKLQLICVAQKVEDGPAAFPKQFKFL